MQVFLSSVQGVLIIVILLSIGYYLAKINWFNEKISDLFSKVVVNISLPTYMVVNITSTFTKKELIHSGYGVIIPFLSIIISYLIAWILTGIFKIDNSHKGTFKSIFSLSNTIFVGLPMCIALFGDIATPYALLYYMANTTIFWTIGVYGIVRDGSGSNARIISTDTLKRIFNPPLISFFISVILVLLNIKLPKFLLDSFKILGNLTTPLSMFCVGITIFNMGFSKFKINKDTILVFTGRFIITPLIVILITLIFPLPEIMRNVFVIMAAMPVMVQSAVLAKFYNADYEYATSMITFTTIFSVIIMPFLMVVLKYI